MHESADADQAVAADAERIGQPATPAAAPSGGDAVALGAATPGAFARPTGRSFVARIGRALAGLALLAAAWGGGVLLILFAQSAWGTAAGDGPLAVRIGIAALGGLGALWLALAAVACLLSGAYCLTLALTRRRW